MANEQNKELVTLGSGELKSKEYSELKSKLHARLLEEIDLDSLTRLDQDTARERISQFILEIVEREKTPLALSEREQLIREILDELFGLGPLEPLLADPLVSDILVNGSQNVYVERQGLLERTDVKFDDDAHVMRIVDRIVSRLGRRVDESSPMADARLQDGSRVNVIIPPLSLDDAVKLGRPLVSMNNSQLALSYQELAYRLTGTNRPEKRRRFSGIFQALKLAERLHGKRTK